ncbi:hypothetical protein [Glaciecola sp. SC05]|uniref:hypothetical protein n=1 Tax=Glaciecola sp. SC05 TaxID=1987355 RepID=UPI0035273A74
MPDLRKSPLSAGILKDNPITQRERNVIDFALLKQKAMLANKQRCYFDFHPLLNGCDNRKRLVYLLAKGLRESLEDDCSTDSEYGAYLRFFKYARHCNAVGVDPFSRIGFLSFCGREGELQRLVTLSEKPLPYSYLYDHGGETGISENHAGGIRGSIIIQLNRAKVFNEQWLRDTPIFSNKKNPTPAYSHNEYNTLLRRLQFVFFSITSQLIAAKEKGEWLDSVEAVFDELSDGSIHTITIPNPMQESINNLTAFNTAMICGYFLFCHYTNLNTTSVLNVCHPIVETKYAEAHRSTRYTTINAWKGRAKKVVQGTFVEAEIADNEEGIPLDIDKRDGLTFVKALAKLSLMFNEDTNNEHPPLFYRIGTNGITPKITGVNLNKVAKRLTIYTDNRIVHAPYLIERFNEVVDKQTITKVKRFNDDIGSVISKDTQPLKSKDMKDWSIVLAYAALRSLTDIPLKNIYMPLKYSEIDEDGNVDVSFFYQNGLEGKLTVASRYVSFVKKLESFAEHYNSTKPNKYHPNQKLTPYLLPLGSRNKTYQWNTLELPIVGYLAKVGIYSGEYLLDVTSKRIRATASNFNFDPNDGGLSVATSLLQNQLTTLEDHYLEGDITQNQVVTSQAVDILHEYLDSDSIKDAKIKVKKSRNIEVLEYDAWKELRMPTNPNGMMCGGEPTGEAAAEHRASQRRSKRIVSEDIKIKCYQYDKCLTCQSAKLVNDISNAYKLLSFIELLQDSIDLMPEREEEFSIRANALMELAEQNLSKDVLEQAEDKLLYEGRYLLHDESFLQTMASVNYHA